MVTYEQDGREVELQEERMDTTTIDSKDMDSLRKYSSLNPCVQVLACFSFMAHN